MKQDLKQDLKRDAVFEAAAGVFAQYGFRRTSMNDIAEAAGISRPALYLMFENKEDLFRQLAVHRQAEAIAAAAAELKESKPFALRFPAAIAAYERVYFEPVFESPHREEFMGVNLSIAGEEMRQGTQRLQRLLIAALEEADAAGGIDCARLGVPLKAFVDLLWASVGGQKKAATSVADFRRRVAHVAAIFLASVAKQK